MPNYRVNRAQFGPYHRGEVIPAYALAESAGPDGDLTELLERGFVTETDVRVTVKDIPKPKVAIAPLTTQNGVTQLTQSKVTIAVFTTLENKHIATQLM